MHRMRQDQSSGYRRRKGMAINYRQCPKCGSKNAVKIVYGMPSYDLFEEAQAGKVKLGGCVITEDNPDYCCKDCEHELYN